MNIVEFLNTADAGELAAHLKGLGLKTAESIVAERAGKGRKGSLHDPWRFTGGEKHR
jgi:DNA uptake protein ComE-like DNA-binding protein